MCLLLIYLLCIYCLYICRCTHATGEGLRTSWVRQFVGSLRLRSWSVVASAFTHWPVSLAPPPKTKPLSVVKFDLDLMILPWLQVHAPMLGHPAIVLFYGYEWNMVASLAGGCWHGLHCLRSLLQDWPANQSCHSHVLVWNPTIGVLGIYWTKCPFIGLRVIIGNHCPSAHDSNLCWNFIPKFRYWWYLE